MHKNVVVVEVVVRARDGWTRLDSTGPDRTRPATYLITIELQEEIVFLLLRSLPMHEEVEQQTGQEDRGDEIENGIDAPVGKRNSRRRVLLVR
jgi:hypothetical protein